MNSRRPPEDLYGTEDSDPRKEAPQSSNFIIQFFQAAPIIAKNLSKNRTTLNAIILALTCLNTWFILELNQKIVYNQLVTKKPYRLNLNQVFLVDDKKMKSLVDIFTKHKVKYTDEFVYSYEKADGILDLVEEIKKYRALPAKVDTPARPKKIKSKPAPSKKKSPRKVDPQTDQLTSKLKKILEEQEIDEVDQKEIDSLIERLEEANERPEYLDVEGSDPPPFD